MPLSGNGMLVNFMDIGSADEAEFNRWYDKEHTAERVAIPGFLEARRYVALSAPAKYLALYTTETFETLSSPEYRKALQSQTAWSLRNIAKFINPTRAIVRVTSSEGQGRGGALAFIRVRPADGREDRLRAEILKQIRAVIEVDGVISAHLLESDSELSKPLVEPETPRPGAGDWYVLLDGTDPDVVRQVGEERFGSQLLSSNGEVVTVGIYRLMWDLSKGELNR